MTYRLVCDGCDELIARDAEYGEVVTEVDHKYTSKCYHFHCMPVMVVMPQKHNESVTIARKRAL